MDHPHSPLPAIARLLVRYVSPAVGRATSRVVRRRGAATCVGGAGLDISITWRWTASISSVAPLPTPVPSVVFVRDPADLTIAGVVGVPFDPVAEPKSMP